MAAAVNQRDKPRGSVLTHVKRATAFGPIKLVRRQGSQIKIGAVDVKRDLAQRLHGVRVEEHTAFAARRPISSIG